MDACNLFYHPTPHPLSSSLLGIIIVLTRHRKVEHVKVALYTIFCRLVPYSWIVIPE